MTTMRESLLEVNSPEPNPLLDRLNLKQQLLSQDDPAQADIKTALVITGGGMRGVFAGGVITAMQELGMTNVFDDVIGISAGASGGAYFLSGQSKLGTSVYYENLATRRFINPMRAGRILDIEFLMSIFRTVKPLNEAGVRNARANFHVGVTRAESGEGEYVNLTDRPDLDMVTVLGASASVPELTKPILVEDEYCTDGVTGCTKPVAYAIDKLGATDVLVVHNMRLMEATSVGRTERIMARLALRSFSDEFRNAHLSRYDDNDILADASYPDNVNIGVICPEVVINRLCTDPEILKRSAKAGEAHTTRIFESVYKD